MVEPPKVRVIPPAWYADPEVAALEAQRVFKASWMCVGLTDDLARHNDFITVEIGDRSVVVQNFDGALKAFQNVCAHRLMRIQTAPCGNRPLTCQYHGWAYNRDGVPLGVPGNAEWFGLDRAAREALALAAYAVDTRGRFVFVRVAPDGPSLAEFLGPTAATLEHVSALFTVPVEDATMPWACNWKLAFETVLEVYHVNTVHPETFKPFTTGAWVCDYQGAHSFGQAILTEATVKWWEGVARKLSLERSPTLVEYDHFCLFPNIAIGITRGMMMSFQTYLPVTPETSTLRYRLFLSPGGDAGALGGAVRKAVTQKMVDFNYAVLAEDRAVAEQVHRGARQAPRPALPGWNEGRIHHFHAQYLDRMKG